jgi:hypothetical protein
MVPHRDMYAQAASAETGLAYFQVLLVLSEKGRDFDDGGAYVDVGDERRMYEGDCLTGDVIVYDGRSIHGVADIDPMKPLELQRLTGRVVGMASLFRLLQPGADAYGRLSDAANRLYGVDISGGH